MSSLLSKSASIVGGRRGKWITLLLWIVIIALLNVIWPGVNSQEENAPQDLPQSALSMQAEMLEKSEFPGNGGIPALVVWYRPSGLTDADLSSIQKLAKDLSEQPLEAQKGLPPLHQMPVPAIKGMLSKDGTSLILPVSFNENAGSETLGINVEEIQKRAAKLMGEDPFATEDLNNADLHARITGPVGIQTDATKLFKGADFSLLMATVLLVFGLLILLYRSPVMALVPLVAVGFAYGVISPLLGIMAKMDWIDVDAQGISIMTVLLFGAGTDYCLFFVSRYRQALLELRDKHEAIKAALSGSGGAIAMSGLTVIVALLALLFAKYGAHFRFAVPFSVAIMIMAIASLTLIPAMLAILGRASFYPFVPMTKEQREMKELRKGKPIKEQKAVGRFSLALGEMVVKRPKTILIASALFLIVLAAFASQIRYTYNILASFPKDMPSNQGFALLGNHYSKGALAPVKVMVETEGKSVQVKEALAALPYVESVSEPVKGKSKTSIIAFEVIYKEDPYSIESIERTVEIRETASGALAKAGITGASDKVWISGQTATEYDTKELVERDTKVVIPVVIAVIAILLLVYLKSITATLYLMITVLLSYFSALGAGWLILHYLLGTDAIQGSIPLFAFVFLVALGEDYNIFMVSSIWQERNKRPLARAISHGVSQTSSVITSAGLILAGTFAVLAVLPIQVLVQFGIICAVGVLLDTFLVRPFLVPTITLLLGKAAFWPQKLEERETSLG